MTGDCHVRFCERLRGKVPRPTHHFGMKVHIGADAHTGLAHSIVTTAANEPDVSQMHKLLHGDEKHLHGDAGYQGAHKREELKECAAEFVIARRRSNG